MYLDSFICFAKYTKLGKLGGEGTSVPFPTARSSLGAPVVGEFSADFIYRRHEQNACFRTSWARPLNAGILIHQTEFSEPPRSAVINMLSIRW